jgi:hypothetical protein
MVKEDPDFFARRAQEERRAAAAATDPLTAAAHARLADQYDALISSYALLENPLGTAKPSKKSRPARPSAAPKNRVT